MLLYITAEDVFGSDTPERRGRVRSTRSRRRSPASTTSACAITCAPRPWRGGRTGRSSGCPTGSSTGSPSGSPSSAASGSGSSRASGRPSWAGWGGSGRRSTSRPWASAWCRSASSTTCPTTPSPRSAPRRRRGRRSRRTARAQRGSRASGARDASGTRPSSGEGLAEEEGVLPLARVMDLAAVLDTAERAHAFRLVSRQVAPESPAVWHAGAHGVERLTHRAAMARTAPPLRARPAAEGDVAYVDAPPRDPAQAPRPGGLRGRRAHHDGAGTRGARRRGRRGSAAAQGAGVGALAGRRVRRPGLAVAGRRSTAAGPAGGCRTGLGGRLRWVEVGSPLADGPARTLAAAGIRVEVGDGSPEDLVS